MNNENVTVNREEGIIKYNSDKFKWEAEIEFDKYNDEIVIKNTTRELTDEERADIIIAILNKYYFGHTTNYTPYLYKYKLKNRGKEKYEEKNEYRKSYSIFMEYLLELPVNKNENKLLGVFRSLITNIRLEVKEAKLEKREFDAVPFVVEGCLFDYHCFIRIINNLKEEFNSFLSKVYGSPVKIILETEKNENINGNKSRILKVGFEEAN